MSNNTSFSNFSKFTAGTSRIAVNNSVSNIPDMETLAKNLQAEAASFEATTIEYANWASKTILGDSISPLTKMPFSQLFKVIEVGPAGLPVVVFNPSGRDCGQYSTNPYGMVNALLAGFGTQRYDANLTRYLHQRKFDTSLTLSRNVRNIYLVETGRYYRQDYKGGRFVDNTPYTGPKAYTNEGANWLSKHTELDTLLMAVAGNQAISYTFFPNRKDEGQYAWEAFKRNVNNNLGNLVSNVNLQIAAQAEVANAMRKEKANAEKACPIGTTSVMVASVMVDDIDIATLGDKVTILVKMAYDAKAAPVVVDTNDRNQMVMISKTFLSKKFESAHLVVAD